MRAAGEAMAEIDAVLWNQGGSGDDVQALCPGRIVSVLAPTSRYAVPFVQSRAASPSACRCGWCAAVVASGDKWLGRG